MSGQERKENIEMLTDMLCHKIMVSAGLRSHPEDNYEISIEDSIKLYNKSKDVFKIIYDEGDYFFITVDLKHVNGNYIDFIKNLTI